jgi:hypothetical protein
MDVKKNNYGCLCRSTDVNKTHTGHYTDVSKTSGGPSQSTDVNKTIILVLVNPQM